MKTDKPTLRFPIVMLLLLWVSILVVVVGSWIGHLYGLPVRSLLGVEGVRWMLGHAPDIFLQSPLTGLITLSLGWGLAQYSGFFNAVWVMFGYGTSSDKRSHLSLRGRRGVMLAVMALLVYVLMICLGLWGTDGVLLNVLGGWEQSAFFRAGFLLFSVALGLAGIIYGYSMGRFSYHHGLLEGMSFTLVRIAPAMVLLFFSCQLFALLDYSGISQWGNFSSATVARQSLETIIYYFPFLYYASHR